MTFFNQNILTKTQVTFAYTLLAAFTIAGLFIPLMDNDSGEYALVAMNMAKNNDYLNIMRKGEDYLDKPHLLFWLSALSMKVFGYTSLAYKLPSVLVAMLGIYSTTKLGTLLYNKQAGILAGLILGFSQAYIFSNHDVRTDALLTGLTATAIYKFVAFSYNNKYRDIIVGSLFLALAVGTKGMVAVFVTGIFIFIHLLYHKKLKEMFSWKWLSVIFWFFIFLSPFLYCYYLQFDAHPEKITKGVQGASGVKFLLWGQSFERLSGQGSMKDNSDFFFFFHTFLWAFLPWAIIAYYGLIKETSTLIKSKLKLTEGYQAAVSFSLIILFLVFSLSQFKLPHYLNILFPLFAVLTAQTIVRLVSINKFKWVTGVLYFFSAIYILAVVAVNGWAFPLNNFLTITIAKACVALLIYFFAKLPTGPQKSLFMILLVVGFSNLIINLNFYPKLLSYQGAIPLSEFVKKNKIGTENMVTFMRQRAFAFDYYIEKDLQEKTVDQLLEINRSSDSIYILTDNFRIAELDTADVKYRRITTVDDYHVTQLTLPFINPKRRNNELDSLILLQAYR